MPATVQVKHRNAYNAQQSISSVDNTIDLLAIVWQKVINLLLVRIGTDTGIQHSTHIEAFIRDIDKLTKKN